jgi:TolA-binding protein
MLRAVFLSIVLAGTLAGPALAQMDSREGIALQNQILELRRDLQVLRSQVGQGAGRGGTVPQPAPGGGGSDISAQLLDRVQNLEDAVRTLRGRIDELQNSQQRTQADLQKQIDDLNFKLGNGGGGSSAAGGPGPSSLGTLPVPATTNAAPARRPPELAMQEGNAALARRDYVMAEADAREVLAAGRSPRAADAQFLLAQALTGRRDYQGAAIAYDDAYNRARTGPRAPDALLGVANALLMLNDRAAACASLEKLRADFPSPRADVREGAAAIRGRAGCR